MKKTVEVAVLVIVTSTFLAGCMNMPTPTSQISASYASGLRYEAFDCSRLSVELDSLARRENQLVIAQEQRVKTSEIQAFWWGYGQGDGIEASELANVRGEKEAVRRAMAAKRCGEVIPSTPSQGSTIEKVKDAPIDKSKPYEVFLVKAVSKSPLSSTGGKCGEATATVYVQGNVVKGTGKTSWGNSFEASGSVDSNGRVNVGMASGNIVFGTFSGVFSGDSSSGIWQDKFQCYGTWTATKKIEPSKKQGDTEIETKLIELKQLLEKGLINQEDYDRKKAKLLDQL